MYSYHVNRHRKQERGLMQETRRLMDNNSASFQMFIILLSFMIAVGSESQMSVDHVTLYSSNVNGILRYLMGGGGGRA